MKELGLGSREIAYLLGVSERTIRRGNMKGTPEMLSKVIQRRLADPRSAQSTRALVMITARRGGLESLLEALFEGYVTMDLLRMR